MISLHSFCLQTGLAKSTVHAYLKSQGFDLSQGMGEDAIAAACERFSVTYGSEPIRAVTPHTQDTPAIYRAGGLVPVSEGTCTRTIALFDAESYQDEKQALEDNARAQAASLNEMVALYAQSRIASVLADIDLVADSVRANALQAMGAASPGKPVAPGGGTPA